MTITPSSRWVSRLRLSHFRNYATAALDLGPEAVVLCGANGAGKTNLMEAVSLLAPGRGLRRAAFENLVQAGTDLAWAVAATVETESGPVDVGTGSGPEETGRRARINGANAPSIEALGDYLRILWLTPAMDGLFAGPPSDRRRFLDRLVTALVPDHSRMVANYEKAMRQRNQLVSTQGDGGWIDALEDQMANYAVAVYFSRADSLERLRLLVREGLDANAFPAAELHLTPLFEPGEHFNAARDLEEALADAWRMGRDADRAAGRTLVGPHRVDLEVVHLQKQMPAALCSTGEQKALLVGLVLAHARVVEAQAGIAPILLLDEVAAHLDPARRAALFGLLETLPGQSFMTGTDPILFDALTASAQRYQVDGGRLTRLG